jgi:DNA-binding NtrC family response regulator
MPKAKILVVDPDVTWTLAVTDALIQDDYEVFSANALPDALLLLDAHNIDIVVVEPNGLGTDPTGVLEQFRQLNPKTALLVHTGHGSINQAVEAVKLGASEYIEKRADPRALGTLRQKIAQTVSARQALTHETRQDPRQRGLLAAPTQGFYGITSQNSRMRDIFELIQTIADSSASVLVEGETGTGKELVARAIHEASARHGKPFITVDCSALARELLESELFGHEKGAFTGAVDRHIGRFERANTGTLLLDEVANIDMAIQAKLLRVLQTRTFERVGGQRPVSVDVRIIAATNRSLSDCVKAGTFREDLYHRLNVVQIEVPPLRSRMEDVPLLAADFLRRFSRQNGKDARGFTDAAVRVLCAYDWPGNVRELENVVLQSVILAKSPMIDVTDLPKRIAQATPATAGNGATLTDLLGQPEKEILVTTLRRFDGNVKRAAESLQVSRTTLYAKLRKHQIDPDALR